MQSFTYIAEIMALVRPAHIIAKAFVVSLCFSATFIF